MHILSENLFSDASVLDESQEQQLNQSLSEDATLFFYESNEETGKFQVGNQISFSDWLSVSENNSLHTETTVTTDLSDYPPGSTAIISGSNFEAGETVELQVLHTDDIPNTGDGHEPWQIVEGGEGDLDGETDGNFQTEWYVNPDDSANSAFELTTTGLNSGEVAIHNFTDSENPEVEFEAGSYVIDMGQDIQTAENTLKGYGLVYELAFNLNVPVQWAIDSEKEFFGSDFTAGGKDYRGGSFIIQEDFITPEVLAIFEDARFSQVAIDQINEEFTAPIFDEITSFPKAVLDLQNGGLAIPYFENAGILPLDENAPDYNPLDELYIMGTPEDLNGCNDVYIMPHADPDSWPESYKSTMYDFVVNQGGWLWAADHAVSALEVTDIAGFGDRFDLNFLGYDDGIQYFKGDPTGEGRYGGHSSGTLLYTYDLTTAGDPELQVMSLFIDDATTNGSEQIYIPFDADGVNGNGGWLPTTTVAVYDPDHPDRIDAGTFPGLNYEATVMAYGPAFGNEEYGNIMYSGGHSYAKGGGAANVAAQRTFFNFLLQSGRDRQPEIDASGFPTEVSSGSSEQLQIRVDSDHGTLVDYEWASTDGVSTFSNQTIQIDPVTGETILTADFTLNSESTIVTIQVNDNCGRQSIHSQVFAHPPPVIDLDGNDSTTTGNDFLGTYRGGGVPTAAADVDVAVSDDSSFIESATIALTNRPDGAAEFLSIDVTAGGTVAGIVATDDGNGGLILSGRTNQADYQKVIATLQYQNNLDSFTETDRVIEVIVNDGISDSEPAVSTLTLNNAPLANDDAYTTNVNQNIVITAASAGIVSNDLDVESESLSVTTNTDPSNGTVTVAADGTLNYVPNAEFTGKDTFEYTVVDTVGNETTATVNIYVNPAGNNPPDAVNDSGYSTPGGVTLSVDAASGTLANDTHPTDLDGDNVTIDRVDRYSANGGTVLINADGSFEYNPPVGFQGTDTFTYTISDGNGGADTATVEIAVTNAPPDAVDDTYDGGFDTPLTITAENGILNNDSDPSTPSDPFSITAFDSVSANGGTVAVNADGSFEYTPPAGFEGTDTFTYTVTEDAPLTGSDTATVTIEVVRPPEADDDYLGTDKNSTLTIDVLNNDTTSSVFDPSSIAIVPGSESWDTNKDKKPKLTINADGTIDFGFFEGKTEFDNGTYTFDYIVADATGQTTTATVLVVVSDKNDPSGVPDFATTSVNTPVTIDVVGNDYTENNPAGWNNLEIRTDPEQGTVAIQTNDNGTPGDPSDDYPEVVYTPTGGFTGTDTFEYRVEEADGDRTQETVVTVTIADETPLADNDAITIDEDSTDNVIDVLSNDFQGDSPATITAVDDPANGTAVINNGVIEYTPNPNFNGTDVFTYTITDNNGDTSTANINVTVNPVNDVPIATDDSSGIEANSTVNIDVTANDNFGGDGAASGTIAIETNPSNGNEDSTDNAIYVLYDDNFGSDGASTGQINITSDPANGTATVNDNGTANDPTDDFIEYSPNANFNGTDQLTYQITDATGDTATANLDITVTSVNDLPQAENDSVITDEGVAVNIPVVVGDAANVVADDFGGDGASTGQINITADPTNGVATVNDNSTPNDPTDDTIDYTPDSGFNGIDQLTYQITDANGDTSTANVNITVDAVNNLPVADNETAVTDEEVAVNIDVTNGDDFGLDGASTGTISVTTPANNGTATVNDNGTPTDPTDDTIDYTPGKDFSGTDNFEYTITDSNGDTSIGQVSVTVNPLNDPPTAIANSYTFNEDSSITGNVITDDTGTGLDSDIDGDSLTVTVNTDPANGTVTVAANGDFTYTPNLNFNGTDSFSYTITDGNGETSSALVNLTIDPVDDVANAIADGTVQVDENSTFNPITVLDNDLGDPDIVVKEFAQPTNGFVRINDNETPLDESDDFLEYSPDRNYTGADSFTYTIEDADGQTDTATVTLNVIEAPNQPPIAVDDTVTVDANTAAGAGQDLTFNDLEPNNDPVTVTQVEFNGKIETNGEDGISGQYGTLDWSESGAEADYTLDNNNTAIQALNIGESLTETFTYTIQDPDGATSSATYTVTIIRSNEKPIATDDTFTATDEDTVTNFATPILANDTEIDPSQTISVAQINGEPVNVGVPFEVSSGALVTLNPDNTISYDPNGGLDYLNDGETGIDVFQYSIVDSNPDTLGGAGFDSALVTIVADGSNDPPTVNLDPNNSGGGADDSNFENTFTEELASVTIMDSDATVFDPDDADFATVTLTIDGLADGSDEILNINSTSFSLDGNSSDTITVGSTTFDIDITGGGTIVTLSNSDPNFDMPRGDLQDLLRSITYRNNSDDPTSGDRTIEIVASDGGLNSTPVTSTITVQPVNDAPTLAVPGSQVASEATPLPLGGISFADIDAGSDPVSVSLNVTNGILNLEDTVTNGLTTGNITNNGTASVTLTGTIEQINTTLAAAGGLSYLGNTNFTGSDNVSIIINDRGNNGVDPSTVNLPATGTATTEEATATIPITVNAIAGIPADAVDNSYSSDEETDATGNLITDNTGAGTDSGDGTLTVTGNTDPANGSVTVAANGDFTYTPDANFAGTDTFTYTIQDTDGDADTANVTITVNPVNDPPVNTVPTAQTVAEGNDIIFNAANGNSISVNDIDADTSDISVTLSSSNGGTFTGLGDTVGLTNSPSLNGTSIVLTGSQTEINEALSGLTLTPNGTTDDVITITTNDQGNTGFDPGTSGDGVSEEDIDTVNIDVIANSNLNTPPVNTVPAAQTTGESSPGVFEDVVFSSTNSNAISITDAEANPVTDTIEVTLNGTNGILNLSTTTNLTITNGTDNSSTVTVQGTIDNINTALEGLTYSPTGTGNGSIEIKTNDLGIAGIDPSVVGQPDTGSNTDERDIDTVSITTVPLENINQAPVNTVPAAQTTTVGTDLVFNTANSNAITINDTDADSNDVQVILTATNGNLTALGDTTDLTSSSGLDTDRVTLIGSQTAINIALDGLTYDPTGTGTGSIQIVTNDLGNTGVDPSSVGLPDTGDANSEEDIDTIDITLDPAPTTGTINGRVWEDTNFDGIKDSGENGLADVSVQLFDSAGNLQDSKTTISGGLYEFTGIAPEDYYLEFTSPETYVLSPQDVGSDDTIDSDPNRATGQTDVFTIAAGDSFANIDAGLAPDSESDTIPDAVEGFTGDRDNDGILNYLDVDPAGYFYNQKTGEVIAGGEIAVTGPGAINVTNDASATGFYQWFIDGTAGTYTMAITPPTGYVLSPNRLSLSPPPIDATGLTPDPYEVGSVKDV